MKIFLASMPGKDQTGTLNKCGVENRLVSYHYLSKMKPETADKWLKRMAGTRADRDKP